MTVDAVAAAVRTASTAVAWATASSRPNAGSAPVSIAWEMVAVRDELLREERLRVVTPHQPFGAYAAGGVGGVEAGVSVGGRHGGSSS
jgi:hypothetical protein